MTLSYHQFLEQLYKPQLGMDAAEDIKEFCRYSRRAGVIGASNPEYYSKLYRDYCREAQRHAGSYKLSTFIKEELSK